jgi:ELWxxDGT repeat protein
MLHDAGGGRFFVYGGGDLYRTDGTAAGSSLVASGLAGVYPAFGGLVTIERGAASTRLRVLGVPGTPSVTVPEPANTAFGADAVLLLGTTTLWSWDGRSARQQLASFASMQDPLYGPLAVVRRDGAAALFLADDGVHGLEPWWTDFTPAGTRLLVDLTPGAAPSRFEVAIAVGERLMFWVRNPATGSEPWSTDGTAAGTAFVGDLEPGPGDSVPDVFSGAGAILSTRRVVFPIQTSATGIEPWITDGTAAGTRLLADLNPGAASSTGYGFSGAPAGGALVFAADDGRGGREPWMIELEGAVAPVPGGCRTRGFYAVEDPVIGAAWPLYAGGVPAPGAALLAQPARAPIDLGERCTLVLDPATSVVLAPIAPDPQGRWAATFPIPNDPGLRGAAFVTQAAWLDPARPLGIELSQAFWLTVGL